LEITAFEVCIYYSAESETVKCMRKLLYLVTFIEALILAARAVENLPASSFGIHINYQFWHKQTIIIEFQPLTLAVDS